MRPSFDPWVWTIPWRREWLPTPVLLPEQFHGQRNLESYSSWGHIELDTTEHLTLSLSFSNVLISSICLVCPLVVNTVLSSYRMTTEIQFESLVIEEILCEMLSFVIYWILHFYIILKKFFSFFKKCVFYLWLTTAVSIICLFIVATNNIINPQLYLMQWQTCHLHSKFQKKKSLINVRCSWMSLVLTWENKYPDHNWYLACDL